MKQRSIIKCCILYLQPDAILHDGWPLPAAGRFCRAPEPICVRAAGCEDTADWTDASGQHSCASHVDAGWCVDGRVVDSERAGAGAEEHCCACGKPSPMDFTGAGCDGGSAHSSKRTLGSVV